MADSDDGSSLTNIRHIPILPTIKEITANGKPIVKNNIVDGNYQIVEHYLDAHFRLLREPYVASIRRAVHDHTSARNNKRNYFYSSVKIENSIYKTDGILYTISFKVSQSQENGLSTGHRVKPGSLLCLSADKFHTVLYATVFEHAINQLPQGTLLIKFEDVYGEVLKLTETEQTVLYNMVELPMNFQVCRHVLEGLQSITGSTIPLKEYIVHNQRHQNRPQYLKHNVKYNLSSSSATNSKEQTKQEVRNSHEASVNCMKNSEVFHVQVLKFCNWPSNDELGLDASQKRALYLALTSSLAVIQGASGTGKTFLANQIVKILLSNHEAWQSPTETTNLLMIFSTTHSLDKFLTEVTSSNMKLVRIAGCSKIDDLNRYNIHNAFSTSANSTVEEISQELRRIKGKIDQKHVMLQLLDYNILHEKELQELTGADGKLVSSLTTDFYEIFYDESDNQNWCPKSFLAVWLGLTFDGFVSEEEIEDFYYYIEENSQLTNDSKMKTAIEATELAHCLEDDLKAGIIDIYDDDSDSEHPMVNQVGTNVDSLSFPISRDSWAVHVQSLGNPFEHFPEENTLSTTMVPLYLALGHVRKVIAERELKKTQEMDDDGVTMIKNAWHFPLRDRWNLYRRWINLYRAARMSEIEALQEEYNLTARLLETITKTQQLLFVQQSDIICTTIAGAAVHRELLQRSNCKIAIVQEAERIPESYLVSVLSPHTEHLILLGDYQQCRSKASVQELNNGDISAVSLFERLIKSNMCHEILQVEHRMQLETENRLPVKSLDVNTLRALKSQEIIAGLSTNVFFVNHNLADTESNQETATCASQFEAEYLLGLCKYLVQQGYEQQAITIVTLCPRQVFVILALLRMEAYFDIRVVTIENYIDEENDIILLTVASHNVNRHNFFVNNDDQVSMVLSNAGKGLYCCGNFGYLSKNSQFYQNLTSNLESCGRIGFNLEIVCQNHPNIKRYVACRDDFRRLSPRGGCLQICGVRQPCGHHCQQVCHLDGHSDCTDVMKVLPSCGHSMLLPCSQDVSVANCVTKVEHVLKKCRHKVSLECHIDVRFYKCRVKVKHVFLLCQHEIEVECSANPNVITCEEACDYRLDCGHRCPRVCHLLDDPDHVDVLCTNPCPKLVCERKHRCQSRCCEPCSTCSIIIGKELLCGHRAMVPCHQDVTNAAVSCGKLCNRILRCGHLCQRACSDPCGKCDVRVEKLLPNCGHTITVRCMFSTEFIKCTKGCTLLLSCGHACTNKCSDPCTQQCNQLVSCTFKPCGHVGTVPCHDRTSSQTNAVFCQALCGRLLPCEHQCKGRCGECRQGRVHTPCRETCGRNLICGHLCETPCSQACMPCKRICENRCTHSRCPKKCGQPCKPCWEPCPWQCPHFQCGKYCNEFCTRPRCDKPCSLLLRCGHLCIGLCGETCPTLCRMCNKAELTEFMLYGNEEDDNAHFIQLEDCGHCIEVEALDHWMDMNADEIQMKGCPRCKTTIWRSLRYGNVIRQRVLDVQKVKKLLFGSKSKLGDTVNYLQDVLTFKNTIQVDFPEEILHLQLCLTQKTTFHQNELVLIENQINILELMTKMKQKTKMMTPEVKNDFIVDMKRLAQRLMQNEEHITEYELGQINCEIRRMFLVAAAADTEKKLAHQINAQCAKHLARAKHILDQGTVFTSTDEKEIEVALETALQLRGGLGISDQERVAIVRAMGFSRGHWYKCPNGHVYAIADCGGAMQISKCNECGARIGGQNHALLTGNAHAGEMDRSPQAAWPGAP